ncbi:hypothetical protein DFH06DRAFT_1293367 [Mycena polygramma]|nr:hypothetical protein DFH06DRAFT_1293367 [Mycena polygramma]
MDSENAVHVRSLLTCFWSGLRMTARPLKTQAHATKNQRRQQNSPSSPTQGSQDLYTHAGDFDVEGESRGSTLYSFQAGSAEMQQHAYGVPTILAIPRVPFGVKGKKSRGRYAPVQSPIGTRRGGSGETEFGAGCPDGSLLSRGAVAQLYVEGIWEAGCGEENRVLGSALLSVLSQDHGTVLRADDVRLAPFIWFDSVKPRRAPTMAENNPSTCLSMTERILPEALFPAGDAPPGLAGSITKSKKDRLSDLRISEGRRAPILRVDHTDIVAGSGVHSPQKVTFTYYTIEVEWKSQSTYSERAEQHQYRSPTESQDSPTADVGLLMLGSRDFALLVSRTAGGETRGTAAAAPEAGGTVTKAVGVKMRRRKEGVGEKQGETKEKPRRKQETGNRGRRAGLIVVATSKSATANSDSDQTLTRWRPPTC